MNRARGYLRPAAAHDAASAWLPQLFQASTPADVAALLFADLPRLHEVGACLMWSTHWPRDIAAWPRHAGNSAMTAVAADVVDNVRAGGQAPLGMRVLHDDGEDTVALLYCPGGAPALDEAFNSRLAEVLRVQRMQEAVARLGTGREAAALAVRHRRHGRFRPGHARHVARAAPHRLRPDVRGELLHRPVRRR
ncbi:hypothetical protein [Agrilutibacter solisilvae]|uniref:Uncharacterized protein n=1 Tax=Agrilutibacter solisilvae TaxID=2763317 RepID=A0A975AST7_9GAMM|nr:hypothetical protein [Lysobacter solisilvae]QSX79117.1 hypothetical protein I8J32_004235 [Lysobacter solisilvae]